MMGYFEKLSGGMARPIQTEQEPEMPPAPAEPAPAPGDGKNAPADDAAERQAHEAAEAKRRAEWDAEQEKKQAATQAQLDKLAAMTDEEAIKAATNRVSSDVEKLTRRNMKEQVAEHIQAVCQRDPVFARRTMLPNKSMVRCYWYINRMAKEFMEQEIKDADPNPASGMYGGDVPDDMVYQWAVDYFDADDVQEDKQGEDKFIPRPYVSKATKKAKGKPGGTKARQEPEKNPEADGQISFLGEVS